jgi:HD superfamily phosphohydrolase YqeK
MDVMGELAPVYSLDPEQALLVGLLHDAAKDMDPARQLELAEEADLPTSHPWDREPLYLHGPVGAHVAEAELGVRDAAVLGAIATHTYWGDGPVFDTCLSWCQRFADLLEPGRDWSSFDLLREGLARFRELVYTGRLREAALLQTKWLIEWFEDGGVLVHPSMRRVQRELLAALGLGDGSHLLDPESVSEK